MRLWNWFRALFYRRPDPEELEKARREGYALACGIIGWGEALHHIAFRQRVERLVGPLDDDEDELAYSGERETRPLELPEGVVDSFFGNDGYYNDDEPTLPSAKFPGVD